MLRYILLKIDIGKEGTDMTAIQAKWADRKIKFILINMAYFSRSFSFYVDGDR